MPRLLDRGDRVSTFARPTIQWVVQALAARLELGCTEAVADGALQYWIVNEGTEPLTSGGFYLLEQHGDGEWWAVNPGQAFATYGLVVEQGATRQLQAPIPFERGIWSLPHQHDGHRHFATIAPTRIGHLGTVRRSLTTGALSKFDHCDTFQRFVTSVASSR